MLFSYIIVISNTLSLLSFYKQLGSENQNGISDYKFFFHTLTLICLYKTKKARLDI